MRLAVITLFPAMFNALTQEGVVGRAVQRGLLTVEYVNPRDFTADRHRTVDDRPFGGGPGMVMKVEPLRRALHHAKQTHVGPTIFLSPQGRRVNQHFLQQFVGKPLILLAGRYEGIDERLLQTDIDEEWSIGDFVLSGGELAAMVIIDVLARLLPGVLGDDQSALQDSFCHQRLDHPHYTRPAVIDEAAVPPVLLGGDHARIARWREQQALVHTWRKRPDLFAALELTPRQRRLFLDFVHQHYAKSAL